MNITLAKTFLSVLENRNFNRSAEYLNVTQSTVTTRINALEERVGQRLFERSRAGVEPTVAGLRFRPYAEMMLQIWSQAQQELTLPNERATQFKIGAEAGLWTGMMDEWMLNLYADRTDISLLVENKSADTLNACLAQGIYDAALLYDVQPRTNVAFDYLFEENLVLVSTTPRVRSAWHPDYIYVEWGRDFGIEHAKIKPPEITPPVIINEGPWALDWIEKKGGSAYFPTRLIFDKVERGELFVVPDINVFTRSVWISYQDKLKDSEWFMEAYRELEAIAERLNEKNRAFRNKWHLK